MEQIWHTQTLHYVAQSQEIRPPGDSQGFLTLPLPHIQLILDAIFLEKSTLKANPYTQAGVTILQEFAMVSNSSVKQSTYFVPRNLVILVSKN